MTPYRADATVSSDGSVTLRDVPFPEGEEVEVIVVPRPRPDAAPTSLRGSVRQYERPFEAAADADEWEAA